MDLFDSELSFGFSCKANKKIVRAKKLLKIEMTSSIFGMKFVGILMFISNNISVAIIVRKLENE